MWLYFLVDLTGNLIMITTTALLTDVVMAWLRVMRNNTIQYNTTVFLERLTKNKSYSKTLYSVIYVQSLVFQP